MTRLFKGAVLGLALAMLAVAQPAKADGAGEVLLERSFLKNLKQSGRWGFRGHIGVDFLDRELEDEDSFNTTNLRFGVAAYKGYFFVRGDGNFSVDDDTQRFADFSSSGYSFAAGVQQPLGRGGLVGGAWVGYGRFGTEVDAGIGSADLDVFGPYVGLGVNYQFQHRGAPGRLSAFLGGRYYFAMDNSDDLDDFGVDAEDGWEIAGGLRYFITRQAFITGGASYREFKLDGFRGGSKVRDITPFVNIGYHF